MSIKDFDYKSFAEELSSQAVELVPAEFEQFKKDYVVNTIKNFATLSGEAICEDTKANFSADQAMLLTQIIAEWSFHKSVDIIKSGILPDYWDSVMQKIAFTIFEIGKQAIYQGMPQDEILKTVEHHVKKTYKEALDELKSRKVIDDNVCERAISQSNIDDMMQQIQEEKAVQEQKQEAKKPIKKLESSKILKLASVALLLKQVSQDKVQTILNKFDPNDAQTVIQYMQMPDLEQKLDKGITMRCLQEIRTNLPEPKYINPNKIIARMNEIFAKLPKENLDRVISKERPLVKEFVSKAREGECIKISSKVANIITQHLEESINA